MLMLFWYSGLSPESYPVGVRKLTKAVAPFCVTSGLASTKLAELVDTDGMGKVCQVPERQSNGRV